jgi:hypothetical protein
MNQKGGLVVNKLLLSVVLAVSVLVGVPQVAEAHLPVAWNNCRGLQQQSTLLGRPTVSARAHFCSARQQLAPQDLSDFNALRRAGDAELLVLDDANGFFSGDFPAGVLHSIGDDATHPTGTNAFGTEWDATAYVYVQFGDYCVFHAHVAPTVLDGEPSFDVTDRSHTCT